MDHCEHCPNNYTHIAATVENPAQLYLKICLNRTKLKLFDNGINFSVFTIAISNYKLPLQNVQALFIYKTPATIILLINRSTWHKKSDLKSIPIFIAMG